MRVPPSEEPALLTPLHVGSTSNWHHCKIRICVITPDLNEGFASARWSEAMDVGAVTKTVAITVPKIQKVCSAANGTDGWMILAKIEQLGHLCCRALTVLPRYILQNRSRKTLYMKEDGVGDEGEYELQTGVVRPLQLRCDLMSGGLADPFSSFSDQTVLASRHEPHCTPADDDIQRAVQILCVQHRPVNSDPPGRSGEFNKWSRDVWDTQSC